MQKITVTCEQMYEGEDPVVSEASYSSSDMSMEGWRYAIEGGALAAGFSIHVLNQMILQWADEIAPEQIDCVDVKINIPDEFL